jgi:hypothetical protein
VETLDLAKERTEITCVDGWNTLVDIVGMSDFHDAMRIPMRMQEDGVQPNVTTFNNLIDAMLHGGYFTLAE